MYAAPPLVGYEPPLVEGFRAEYGEDPLEINEKDPRWLSYRCKVLTQFMREVRSEMDAVAQEQSRYKRIDVSVIVSGIKEENILHGMDLKTWVSEGLIDTLIPYTMAPRLNSTMESWPDIRDIAYWVSLTKDTSCKLAPGMLPRFQSPEDYRRKAMAMYKAGIEYLFFWDCNGRTTYNSPWDALRRLGHKEEIETWIKAGEPGMEPTYTTLYELGGWNLEYDSPG